MPREALRIADLGYFRLDRLQELAQQGTSWLTRIQAGTAVFDAHGRRWDLAPLLASQQWGQVELSITWGVTHRMPCRLLAQQVPPALLTLEEARVLARVRWQSALLFKLWKSPGHSDEWRSSKPWRMLCEI